jgi:hypothetical protein
MRGECGSESVHFFLYIMYSHWRSHYQEARVGIPLIGLTLPHPVSVPKPGHAFPKSYVVIIFNVCFIDIGGIVDHHCLSFLFIK